ncbi:hypothetical protein FBEOM_418 [Fusarium beomiforme]|uniref:Rhodopsin domain-containing protein n=1 Tax=Fusarium beomiforme TaxID=44412 RepID=A0A9P5AV82_9HYPO|nr:hypothetical protein FBEOM_418 [Fusarium beomiforme]
MNASVSQDDGLYRFSPVTFNDHAGKLWIVTILSLIYTSLIGTARAYIKYKMFGFDDILFACATVLHLGQSIAVFVGLSNGLGKFNSITTPDQWTISSKSTIASVILGLLSLSLAKCSVLALILRIISSKPGRNKLVCMALMCFTGLWGVGSSLAWLVNCRAGTLLTVKHVEQCPDQNARWGVITAIDILTEILTWLLVLHLSWSVNISFARKCQVVTAFSFRIPLIAISSVHLAYSRNYPGSLEPQFAVTNALICQQVMIAWSLISATMPNLKNFLKSFSIGMGFPVAFDFTMSGSSKAYALQSLRNNRSTNAASAIATAHSANWRPDQVSSQTTAAHRTSRSNSRDVSEEGSSSRAGSQELIINKEVAWNVTYENHHDVFAKR